MRQTIYVSPITALVRHVKYFAARADCFDIFLANTQILRCLALRCTHTRHGRLLGSFIEGQGGECCGHGW